MNENLSEYSADGLIQAYLINQRIFADLNKQTERMARILADMEEELEERGIYGNVPQNSNAI